MAKSGHELDLLGQANVDFEERVNIPRLKRERLQRLQAEMAKAGLGGMLFFDPILIRYATGVRYPGIYAMRGMFHYVIVPQEGAPYIPEDHYDETPLEDQGGFAESDRRRKRGSIWEFLPCGRNVPEAARMWGETVREQLTELGIHGERLGIDRLDYYGGEALRVQGITVADGRVPAMKARSIKTVDEIMLIRQACAIADVAITRTRDAIEPGVTENQLFAILTATNLEFGGENMDSRMLASGDNTKPWSTKSASSDRMVRPGDLVAYDTDMMGPMGYFADISRTYLCGDGRPNQEQMEAHRLAYDFIYESMELFRPGMSFQEIAEQCPPYPPEYRDQRYEVIAHGAGMCQEWPAIYWPDQSWGGFGNDPEVLEEGMVLSIEGLAAKTGGRESVKLEEQVLITANGPELLSLAPFDERLLT